MKSPLRYPGGKTRAIKTLFNVFKTYFNKPYETIVSPFCGGCSFELFLLSQFPNTNFILNDLFKPLIVFWKQCQSNNDELVENIQSHLNHVDKQAFTSYREDLLEILETNYNIDIAVYYFIINRCSFSGATFSGGFSKESAEKRFTQSSIDNIVKLKSKLNNIEFTNTSFEQMKINKDSFIFCDPPYYLKNKSKLYGINGDLHDNFEHELFHKFITSTNCDYIITYNDCPFIRELYKSNVILEAEWSYGMNKSHKSSEIIILSRKASKGSIPHMLGSSWETHVQQYFLDKGFDVNPNNGNTTSNPDVIIHHNDTDILIECKTKITGVDYKQYKLNYIDGRYESSTDFINEFMPENLFNNQQLPQKLIYQQ